MPMLEAATYHAAAAPGLCQRALANLPRWAEDAAASEQRARLGAEGFAALWQEGWLDLVSPRSPLPGDSRWPTLLEISRIAARACPSSAWMIALVGGHASIVGRLPPALRQTLYASGAQQLFASASASDSSRFTWTPAGIQVEGRWRFSSGIQDATWLLLNAPCAGHPDADPATRWLLPVPVAALEVLGNWAPCGMAATGSHDVRVRGLCVPHEQVMALPVLFGQRPQRGASGYLDHVPLVPYLTTSIIGPLLGCAEGAYARHLDGFTRQGRALDAHGLEQTAHAAAELACARLLYQALLARLHDAGVAGEPLDAAQQLALRRDRSYLAQRCVGVVQRLVRQQGASSLSMGDALQRHWRDVQAMALHRDVAWAMALQACADSHRQQPT
ncbi:hypothetical protein P0Y43_01015 [Pseudomonas entomophila]|uniref:hypothetical protein n=1 Tax=Pseudomonas entomophila TaxID=312306 RepID=UPI0023D85476|nr:hypothetical protein [Pseudomonas entomophila]MDF0729304.1 hypothetical protein [Pseudomonas entomophila]